MIRIKGIDIDRGQVESSKKKGLDVELVSDSIKYLNEQQNSFDVLVAFDLLEHIAHEHQINFTKTIFNSLKSGGIFIGSVPNANSILGSRNRYIDFTHHVTFTEISLDFILFNGGFRNIKIIEMDFVHFSIRPIKFVHWCLFKIVRLFRRIAFVSELGFKQGGKVPLSFNLIAEARK